MSKKVMNFGKMRDELFLFYKRNIAVKDKSKKKWDYNGYDTTSNCILATSPSVKIQLSKEEFEFRTEFKGHHPIELLLNAAIQLGIQQGINICKDDPSIIKRKD